MIEYQEKYGSDADGNRGIIQWNYELEPSDRPVVKELIIEQLAQDEYEYTETLTIFMMSYYMEEEVEFDVEISEYLTKTEYDKVIADIAKEA